jgi:hypothetical protein
LFRKGDARRVARALSCDQEIASDGAFSLGMIAEFDEQIKNRGEWWYPRIFWFVSSLLFLVEIPLGRLGSLAISCIWNQKLLE